MKHRMILMGTLCLIFTLLPSCAPSPQQEAEPVTEEAPSIEADVEAIRKLCEEWEKAYCAGDAEAAISYYADGAVVMSPNNPMLVGKEAAGAFLVSFLDQFTVEGRAPAEDVRVSGDMAVARGTYSWTFTPKASGSAATDEGKWMCLFERQSDGSWKYLWDIWNSDKPAPEPPTT